MKLHAPDPAAKSPSRLALAVPAEPVRPMAGKKAARAEREAELGHQVLGRVGGSGLRRGRRRGLLRRGGLRQRRRGEKGQRNAAE